MADEEEPEEELDDPAEVTDVYITVQHVYKTAGGTYAVKIFDVLGNEIADVPLVADARDWAEALELMWRDVGKVVRLHNNAENN